jgi:mRNA interferase MazF
VATQTEHGEIWLASMDKRRPVVVVSRDDVQGKRAQTTVAVITTRVRQIPTEVTLDARDGVDRTCVVNCDYLETIEKTRLERRIARLSELKLENLRDALRFALQLD